MTAVIIALVAIVVISLAIKLSGYVALFAFFAFIYCASQAMVGAAMLWLIVMVLAIGLDMLNGDTFNVRRY